MENLIEIRNLYKSFGEVKAVNDLSFDVKKGEFFAFLGINGAGKSTTISILCGELKQDKGTIKISGKSLDENFKEIKRKLGVVYQNSVLDKHLSVYENLALRTSLYRVKDIKGTINKYADLLQIKDLYKREYGKLSGGQKRRVDIARALLHEPEILILDEPTTGLDPKTRKLVWEVIHQLRKENNLTVFLTTHYMEEVTDASYIVILDKGNIVSKGTPLELKNKFTGDYIYLYNVSEEDVITLGQNYERIRDGFKIEVENTEKATQLIVKHQEIFVDYELVKGKMDDVFLNATGVKLGGE